MQPRRNGHLRLLATLCIFVGLGIAPSVAFGDPTPLVSVDCAVLNDEQRASLEARARAELAMNRVTSGQIYIHCWSPLMLVEYMPPAAPVQAASGYATGDTDQWLEQILSLVHSVLLAHATSLPAPPQVQSPPADTPPPARVQPAPLSTTPVEIAPVPMSPVARRNLKSGRPRMQVGVGVSAEAWAKPLDLLPGPCASLGVRTSSWSRVAATGGVHWAASRVSDIAIRHWYAGIEWRFGGTVWIAAGAQLSAYDLMPTPTVTPNADTTYEPLLSAKGGLSVPLLGEHLQTGIGLRAQRKRQVRFDGRDVFAVPLLALTTDVQYELEF